jgi:methionyl-tRNA formyltransferase
MEKRIIFMGTPEFAIPSLEALIRSAYRVVGVYTQPDRKSGRGQAVTLSPVKQLALSRGLELVQPDDLKTGSVIDRLKGLAPDLIVVAAFGQILPPQVLAAPGFGCINVHPSLLPRYRGASPVATVILQGDEVTGVTIMSMDAGMDTGPILSQREVPISTEYTTGSLTIKLAEIGAQLLMETLPLWIDGLIKPRPQDETEASYSKVINKNDGEMDWRLPTQELWRRVRAFNPWPECYTRWRGKRLKLSKVVPLYGEKSTKPGTVITLSPPAPATVGVGTGDGVLGLVRVQLEGKRELSAEEFVRGQREFVGSHLL